MPFSHGVDTSRGPDTSFTAMNTSSSCKNFYLKLYASFSVEKHWPFWPRNPKFNRGHLLVMTNHHTKLEDPSYWSDKVCLRTDQPTDICKAIYSLFFGGGHNQGIERKVCQWSTLSENFMSTVHQNSGKKEHFNRKTIKSFFRQLFRTILIWQFSDAICWPISAPHLSMIGVIIKK